MGPSRRRPGKRPGDPGEALRLVDDPTERLGVPAPAPRTSVHVAPADHLTLLHTGDRSARTIDDGGGPPALGPDQVLVLVVVRVRVRVLVRDGYAGHTRQPRRPPLPTR